MIGGCSIGSRYAGMLTADSCLSMPEARNNPAVGGTLTAARLWNALRMDLATKRALQRQRVGRLYHVIVESGRQRPAHVLHLPVAGNRNQPDPIELWVAAQA